MKVEDIGLNDIDGLLKFIKQQIRAKVYHRDMLSDLCACLSTHEAAEEFFRRYEEEILPLLREKK